MTTTAPAPRRDTVDPSRPRWLVGLAVAVVFAVAAAITAVFVARDDDSADARLAVQLSQVQAACRDWMTSPQTDGQSDDQWCTDMFAWMSDQSGGTMMGSMMWQGPQQLSQACREWVTQDRADFRASGTQHCEDMVAWMNGHMSSRDGNWMMRGADS